MNQIRQQYTSDLDAVFGPGSTGDTPDDRARTSDRLFVRSIHQLSFHQTGATGRLYTAKEALELFGWDKLKDLADRLSTPLIAVAGEPFDTLKAFVDSTGVSFDKAAKRVGWDTSSIESFKNHKQVQFRQVERLAQHFSLDERKIGIVPAAGGDKRLSFRLRELKGGDAVRFSDSVVLTLSEAAWVIGRQVEFVQKLYSDANQPVDFGFMPNNSYGNYKRPAWQVGLDLASEARELLGLSREEPILSLKALIEERLFIPLIQTELSGEFAGATVASGKSRGILVNVAGLNENVWVRRMTMAHELGHLLYDPDERLRRLVVDDYTHVQGQISSANDYVEMRANAFAVEFLAPQESIRKMAHSEADPEALLMSVTETYGISKTAAMFQIQNALREELYPGGSHLHLEPSDEWTARENMTLDFFKPPSVPFSRRGKFCFLVSMMFERGHIGKDTAAALLSCDPREVDIALRSAKDLMG